MTTNEKVSSTSTNGKITDEQIKQFLIENARVCYLLKNRNLPETVCLCTKPHVGDDDDLFYFRKKTIRGFDSDCISLDSDNDSSN